MAWLSGWTYRKSITLARASGAVNNHVMQLLVGESSGATGEDVDCGGKCNTDFSDIRFTSSDGTTLQKHWRQSVTGTTPNQLATHQIKFDTIGTGATTFYMYYGKADAVDASSGADTFLFFDDFPGTSLDGDKWDTLFADPTISVGSSILTLTNNANTDKGIIGVNFLGANYKTVFRCKSAHYNSASYNEVIGIREDSGTITFQAAQPSHGASKAQYRNGNGTNYSYANMAGWAADTYCIFQIAKDTDKAIYSVDGANAVEISGNYTTDNVAPYCYLYANGASVSCDWVYQAPYLATEPAWGSWGDEEATASSNFIYGVFKSPIFHSTIFRS